MIFDSITGHNQQKSILQHALDNQRVAHAYLFEGSDGIGKKMMAIFFARALLCQTGNGCGECSACLKVDHHNHPDIHQLDADGAAIKIDQIRGLQQNLSLRPLEGNYKVCLIDGAEHFTKGAANALLKTLEEPQPGTLIILLTSQPQKLLPTICSRCQRLPFSRLPKEQLAAILMKKLDLSKIEATVLAALSEGSFKKALGPNRELFLEKRHKLIQSLSALSAGSIIPTFSFAEELEKEKETLTDILDIFQTFYRDLLLLKHAQPEDELVNLDLLELLHHQNKSTTASLLQKLKALESARFHLQRNVNRRLALEVMLMRITTA
ncbi:MAG: DNA polymerase III subunit delta' [Thermodesulfobacteriota bacterium]|nr:DNA polymerase III subunit delta' [Thermodesulfobacteriota bacterium]